MTINVTTDRATSFKETYKETLKATSKEPRKAATLRTVSALVEAGLVAPEGSDLSALKSVAARYSVAVSEPIKNCIDLTHLESDPVARQFVPDVQELVEGTHSLADPIGDDLHSPVKGLVHRYADRVLLKATELCPVYCRFCFRRESVGGNAARPLSAEDYAAIFDYIAQRSEIWEVIISGGDPLVLSDARLSQLMQGLSAIAHVKVVRVHTRVPVVEPSRITPALLDLLKLCQKTLYVAVHANHANEFSAAARSAVAALADAGIPLVSQTVLLRGVNDSEQALGDLMRTFVELRITPYYLHQLDLAPGTEHFRVPIAQGQALLKALRGTWSGLCQPTYVIDLPGGHGKVSVGPNYMQVDRAGSEDLKITDPSGISHSYTQPKPSEHDASTL